MDSTMQDFPLTITAIMRHACGVHGARTITTATGDGYRHTTYRELGQQVAQLANALRRLGVTGDQRVATFMWNNAEHLATYLAAPSMGAVLHTLNIRLFPEQVAYVANEAEDQVVLVDMSLAQYRILTMIGSSPQRAGRLAQRAALSKSTLTGLLDGLVTRGWVRRIEIEGDRRGVGLELTDEGSTARVAAEVALVERMERYLGVAGAHDRAVALAGLAALHRAVQASSQATR